MPNALNQEFLGRGLLQPIQRIGASDFKNAAGIPLVREAVKQIIGTNRGEIRWRPTFGVRIAKYKNKPNTDERAQLLGDELMGAIKQNEPRISTLDVTVNNQDNKLIANISWAVIETNVSSNNVLVGPDNFSVTI